MNQGVVLVTGGCGYIGSHIVQTLSEKDFKVVILDDLSHGRRSALLHKEKLFVGNICDSSQLERIFRDNKIEAVFHCAAAINAAESMVKKDHYYVVNADGSRTVFETAGKAGVRHILFASSAAIYGNSETSLPMNENQPPKPNSPYGNSKLIAERYLQEAARIYDFSYCIFRFFNVAGAGSTGKLKPSLSSQSIMQKIFTVAAGKEPILRINGNNYNTLDGTVERDFVHVVDIADAHLLALTYLRKGGGSEIFNLGSGVATSLQKLIKITSRITGKNVPVIYEPRTPGDIVYSLSNSTKAKAILGWSATHTIDEIARDGWNAYTNHS